MTRLRRAYPLTVASLWTSVLALFLVALRIPRSAPFVGTLATAAVPILAASAIWSLSSSASAALSVLQNANLHVAQRGFASMLAAAVLSTLAVGVLFASGMKRAHDANLPPA